MSYTISIFDTNHKHEFNGVLQDAEILSIPFDSEQEANKAFRKLDFVSPGHIAHLIYWRAGKGIAIESKMKRYEIPA